MIAPILSIDALRVEYPFPGGEVVRAVDDVTLTIEPGEIHALVGESGAGKSTVGNAVMGLIDPPGRIASGTVLISGRRLGAGTDAGAIKPGRDLGAIFQDPMTSLNPLFTIGSQLVETMRFHIPIDGRAAKERAIELLRTVEIPEPERRFFHYPHQLSGGQRQRVVIAAALSCDPKLLVADEPTTALDVSVQAQILRLIRRLADERRLAVLLVTHNMGAVAQVADRVSIMRSGRILESGPTGRVLQAPQHDYARNLIRSVPKLEAPAARFAVPGEEIQDVRRAHNFLQKRACDAEPGVAPDILLDVQGLTVEYASHSILRGRRIYRALEDATFSVKRGEIFGVVGESGSGKTTLAHAIAGLIAPTGGQVSFEGHSILSARGKEQRRAIQMVFQDPYSSLNARMRVGHAISEPIHFYRLAESRAAAAECARSLLEAAGLSGEMADRFPYAFSGGQRQRISIARALAAQPSLLICDEPTSSLDVSVQARILNLLKDLRDATQLTLLFISHDLAVVRQMCDRVAVMNAGRIVELADSETLFNSPQHEYTRHLLASVPSLHPVGKPEYTAKSKVRTTT